jgi:hypothetical protein
VGLSDGLPLRLPGWTRLRNGLEGACLSLRPHLQAQLLTEPVGPLDQLFLGVVSGSVVRTTDPSRRWRRPVPV